jgi:hypothetical protein
MASLKNLAREGFGVGIGFLAAFAVYIFFGLLFFIPGFVLFTNEQKKRDRSDTVLALSAILMLIGVVIMGGIGLGMLLDNVSELF